MSVGGILGGGFASAFLAIAPIVNPLGCAVLFTQRTARCPRSQRAFLARRIAINAALVLLAAMWAGTALMALLGVELPALRIAGGLVVAVQAWRTLDSGPESDPDISKVVETTRCDLSDQGVFVPLTIPFTTGPGTLAAAMALGAARPAAWGDDTCILGRYLCRSTDGCGVRLDHLRLCRSRIGEDRHGASCRARPPFGLRPSLRGRTNPRPRSPRGFPVN
jgi:small neutral amino acid transporter SnatA (MarC family)